MPLFPDSLLQTEWPFHVLLLFFQHTHPISHAQQYNTSPMAVNGIYIHFSVKKRKTANRLSLSKNHPPFLSIFKSGTLCKAQLHPEENESPPVRGFTSKNRSCKNYPLRGSQVGYALARFTRLKTKANFRVALQAKTEIAEMKCRAVIFAEAGTHGNAATFPPVLLFLGKTYPAQKWRHKACPAFYFCTFSLQL